MAPGSWLRKAPGIFSFQKQSIFLYPILLVLLYVFVVFIVYTYSLVDHLGWLLTTTRSPYGGALLAQAF